MVVLTMRWSVNHIGHCVCWCILQRQQHLHFHTCSRSRSRVLSFQSHFISRTLSLSRRSSPLISLARAHNLDKHSTSNKHHILLNLLIIYMCIRMAAMRCWSVKKTIGWVTNNFKASYPIRFATTIPVYRQHFQLYRSLAAWIMATIYIRIVVGLWW